jgi:hypothetical protein
MATKAAKEITLLKRAVCKKSSTSYAVAPGDIIFLVKGEKNSVHETILRNNGRHSCTCKGNAAFGRNCYHIKGCEASNNARIDAAKVTIEVIETPESLEAKEWAQYRSELAVKLAQQYMTTQVVEQIAERLMAPVKTPIAKIIEQAVQASVPAIDLSKVGDLGGTRKYSLLR